MGEWKTEAGVLDIDNRDVSTTQPSKHLPTKQTKKTHQHTNTPTHDQPHNHERRERRERRERFEERDNKRNF